MSILLPTESHRLGRRLPGSIGQTYPLYTRDEGRVLVDDVDVRDYRLPDLRERIGVVLQNNTLFSGTIRENIMWGNEQATEEEVITACKDAQAHDFIMSFPNGYDTVLGQGGVNVSGGQKQRLCIARAILKNPKILILDDSTSAVDMATEQRSRSFLSYLQFNHLNIAQRCSDRSRLVLFGAAVVPVSERMQNF